MDIYCGLIWQINFFNDDEELEARHTQTAAAGSEGCNGRHQDVGLIN